MSSQGRRNRGYIVIDTDRCKGCSICISVCPKEIIGTASGINRMGYTPVAVIEELAAECTGCRVCSIMCPDVAVSVYRVGSLQGPASFSTAQRQPSAG